MPHLSKFFPVKLFCCTITRGVASSVVCELVHKRMSILTFEGLSATFKALTNVYFTYFCHKIKTHDSESRGQEEAGRTRRMSVLFTGSTGVKFVNALNKPPLKLLLSYQGLSTF